MNKNKKLTLRKLTAAGFSHILLPALIVVIGVGSFGAYKVVSSSADTKLGVIDINSAQGCKLAGRVFGTTASRTQAGCLGKCIASSSSFVAKTSDHLAYCSMYITTNSNLSTCVTILHRYYVANTGCSRKPTQTDGNDLSYCLPGYPFYDADHNLASGTDKCLTAAQSTTHAVSSGSSSAPTHTSTPPTHTPSATPNPSTHATATTSTPVVPSTSTGSGTSFIISSFNIYYSSDDSNKQYSEAMWPERLTRSTNVIKSHNIDVAGLQEVRQDQWQGIQASSRLGSSYGIYPSHYDKRVYASQNPIIWNRSRFTLVASGTKTIPGSQVTKSGTFANSNTQVELKDNKTGQQFFVINTHEPVGSGADTLGRYNSAKNRAAYVKQLATMGQPIFLTGDFNAKYSATNQCQ